MSNLSPSCPMTRAEIVDAYFMEHRAKLVDIAAYLDRLDRARDGNGNGRADFRMKAFRRAFDILAGDEPHRAKRLLELFSDPTTDPIAKAPMKGATGAYDGEEGGA